MNVNKLIKDLRSHNFQGDLSEIADVLEKMKSCNSCKNWIEKGCYKGPNYDNCHKQDKWEFRE